MQIHLLQGEFNPDEALSLVTQMIQIKIRYHESKIAKHSSEEDIKYRESRIKMLQRELFDLRKEIEGKNGNVKLEATIQCECN